MRRLSVILALLLALGFLTHYKTKALSARPIPGADIWEEQLPSPTSGTRSPLSTPTPAFNPVNASENSLAGAATTSPRAVDPTTEPEADQFGTIIRPDHPFVSYIGRFDFATAGSARFDWPGTSIEATFTGTSVTILLAPADNHFNVLLDGTQHHIVPGKNLYHFRVDPALERHTIRLTKRTEAYAGMATFRGFILDQGQRLLAPPAASARRIEFLGDSITAGYGAAGASAACDFTRDTQDVELTYAALTARAFDVDYSVIAMSGLGAVRNYQQDAPTSAEPLLAFYPRTLALMPASRWSFEQWQADAVVIYLGTNDFSSTPWPSEITFVDGYTEMMAQIRADYPRAHIFAVAGPLLFGPAEEYIQAAVERMQGVDDRVHFVPISIDLEPAQMGCDFHPNAAGHRRIARQLIPVMAEQLGW